MVCMLVLNTVHFTEVVVGGTEDLLADMEAAAAAAAAQMKVSPLFRNLSPALCCDQIEWCILHHASCVVHPCYMCVVHPAFDMLGVWCILHLIC